jgi:polyphosphate kinase
VSQAKTKPKERADRKGAGKGAGKDETRRREHGLKKAPRQPSREDRYLNRELSWLEFNRRVLSEATSESNPLLERLKFIAIFDGNLDEFFMKRVGGLKQQLASNVRELTPDGSTPRKQLQEIDGIVRPLLDEQRRILFDDLLPQLREQRVKLLAWDELSRSERRFAQEYFERHVYPILTPLAVDAAHPFPFISNLSLSLAVAVRHSDEEQPRFARVKVPQGLPRFVPVPDSLRFVRLEELVAHNLERLFPSMEVLAAYPFRVTRNADLARDEETAEDLLEVIQEELRERRFATVVRLEVEKGMPDWILQVLCSHLGCGQDVYPVRGFLGLRDLFPVASLPLHHLRYKPWTPVSHPRLSAPPGEEVDVFAEIRRGDLLVHHPYDSFHTSVNRFIASAALDPEVLALKQTLYRTSSDSPIMKSLIRAAEGGKQVAVSVEIKARFDEANNIEWGEALDHAGAHVSYGHVGLKNHAKLALVVREEADQPRCYTHIGTGNYNADTAKLYTDLGLLTANPVIASDVVKLFNMLTGYLHRPKFEKLLVAPVNMKSRFLALIRREIKHQKAGKGGHLIAKMNGLEDPDVVDALYEASQAGVEIDLVVRGICRLRPGVPELSETIRVLSIVGRFLEHTRLYYFANGGDPEYYLGSADWMSRNLRYRVEAVVPVEDPALQSELRQILDHQLADNVQAWQLESDGSYTRRAPGPGEEARSSQEQLMERALGHSARAKTAG